MIPTTRELPLHDEASGIRNLDAREQRQLRFIDTTATFCIGMVLGALLVATVFLIANH
jgi:hypothetical protein